MAKIKLSNVEFESIMLFVFVAFSMLIRGVFFMFMSAQSVMESEFYQLIHAVFPIQLWGFAMVIGASIVLLSIISMTSSRYILLVIGSFIGLLVSAPMTMIGFAEGMNFYTPLQTGILAFFNSVLIVHGGVVLWKEKTKTRS